MPDAYRRLPSPTLARRSFAITIGLQEGYDGGIARQIFDAVDVHARWMLDRVAAGLPYLTGVFTPGTLSYAWPRPGVADSGQAAAEPAVVFSGEANVLYHADLDDDAITVMLDDLAGRLGAALGQTRVYVAYRDNAWVLERQRDDDA